jgi:beta-galactosidase
MITNMRFIKYAMIVVTCFAGAQSLHAQVNDFMFPAAPEAKKSIDYDAKGFLINGKRTFLVSAGMEYARIPHQLWYDRLMRLKRAGFNCIEIYTFWNFHEPHEGQFEFSGDQDLDAFLKMVKQLGMYAIPRVGPYYCAEWDSGGYPIWLRFKDNMIVRSPNAEFEKYMDRFFDKLLPIIANNQINKGGSVILVQLENEHPASWGTNIPNDYFKHLQEKALAMGIKVPYFFSGLNHGNDPAGKKASLDEPDRPNPWFTTEFWSVWYNLYGSTPKDADTYGRRTWKIIARGGNGYNYYMAHGGTNFNYSFSHEDAASYDYGAAVGQTGDLRPIYYQFKRNALFARSFQDVLENSVNSEAYKNMLTDTGIVVTARHSEAGDLLFFDHASASNVPLTLIPEGRLSATKFTLTSGEILPVPHNFKLTDDVTLDWGLSRILGICKQGNTTTLVMYGPAGSTGDLELSSKARPVLTAGSRPANIKGNQLNIHTVFDAMKPLVYNFKSGKETIRIVALNTELADRTWFVGEKGKNYVVTGPEYIADLHAAANGKTELNTEHFWEQKNIYPTWLYGEGFSRMTPASKATTTDIGAVKGKFSGGWQAKNASPATAVKFDDSGWKKSEKALEMGADDDITANAWYRANVNIKRTGSYTLSISKGGGRFIVFIDNKRVADGMIDNLQFDAPAGNHLLTIYAAHDGRDKLYNFIGNLQNTDIKGIAGDVILHRGPASLVAGWKMLPADGDNGGTLAIPSFANAVPYQPGARGGDQNPLKRGYAWFQAEVPVTDGRIPLQFNFRGIAENAVVFINGKQVARQEQRNKPLIVSYVDAGNTTTPVIITVFAENRSGQNNRGVFGAINRPVEITYRDDQFLTGWSMKGGPGDMNKATGWQPLHQADQFDRPYFFRNKFTVNNGGDKRHPMWRVSFDGLSHGFVFVNGHNIGGYPEKVPIKSMYIPECWLKEGENTIVIYDQYGNRPDKVTIAPETAASRNTQEILL